MLEAEYMLFMLNSSLTIFVDFLLFFLVLWMGMVLGK